MTASAVRKSNRPVDVHEVVVQLPEAPLEQQDEPAAGSLVEPRQARPV